MAKLKPVMALAAIGDTAMSPVITELGTVEMPDFARMTKLLAVPRSMYPVKIELGSVVEDDAGNAKVAEPKPPTVPLSE
jgi:hypothetical protein